MGRRAGLCTGRFTHVGGDAAGAPHTPAQTEAASLTGTRCCRCHTPPSQGCAPPAATAAVSRGRGAAQGWWGPRGWRQERQHVGLQRRRVALLLAPHLEPARVLRRLLHAEPPRVYHFAERHGRLPGRHNLGACGQGRGWWRKGWGVGKGSVRRACTVGPSGVAPSRVSSAASAHPRTTRSPGLRVDSRPMSRCSSSPDTRSVCGVGCGGGGRTRGHEREAGHDGMGCSPWGAYRAPSQRPLRPHPTHPPVYPTRPTPLLHPPC